MIGIARHHVVEEAARRLGLAPANCLVIEDAVSGVAAVRAAGWHCLRLNPSLTPDQTSVAGAERPASDVASGSDGVIDW